jgi:hypothetical protein
MDRVGLTFYFSYFGQVELYGSTAEDNHLHTCRHKNFKSYKMRKRDNAKTRDDVDVCTVSFNNGVSLVYVI